MREQARTGIGWAGYALMAWLSAAGPAAAGIGAATSGLLSVDTAPPAISGLSAPTGGATFRSPATIVFDWNLQDDSPALSLDAHRADILAGGDVLASLDLESRNGDHAWNWPVAEVVSGACRLRVTARDIYGNQTVAVAGDFRILLPGTGAPPSLRAPLLAAPAPNPFNPRTDLAFEIGDAGRARLAIHDAAGRLIRTLCDGPLPAGRHVRAWDGCDGAGRRVAGGAYLVRLTVDGRAAPARKVVLLP